MKREKRRRRRRGGEEKGEDEKRRRRVRGKRGDRFRYSSFKISFRLGKCVKKNFHLIVGSASLSVGSASLSASLSKNSWHHDIFKAWKGSRAS